MATSNPLLLVFTDSRGRDLDIYLDDPNILVKAFKGAELLQIILNAEPIIKHYNPAGVLFIGGTCDLTVLNRVTELLPFVITVHQYKLSYD